MNRPVEEKDRIMDCVDEGAMPEAPTCIATLRAWETSAPLPIRNPEEFLAAVDRSFALIADLATERRAEIRDEARLGALVDELERVTDDIRKCPFQMAGDRVIAKGFTPRMAA
jgi:hypothetical protein